VNEVACLIASARPLPLAGNLAEPPPVQWILVPDR